MIFTTCVRCSWPSRGVNAAGLCDRCWKGPPLIEHGPETLQQHEKRRRQEAREAERQKKQQEERIRRLAAECIANYRLCCGYTQRDINEAQALDDKGEDSSKRWVEAAEGCARIAAKALYVATLVPPSHWRTWTRRAANTTAVGSQCMSMATRELRRQLKSRKGAPGLQVVSGEGVATAETKRPALRLISKGEP